MARITWFAGAVWALVLPLAGHAGTLTPIYTVPRHIDGSNPFAPLVRVGARLFGVSQDGANSCGAVFSIDPKTAAKTGRDTIVYSFTCKGDGGYPRASLAVMGGKLYGTNTDGGASGHGVVFEIDPATGAETTLCSFAQSLVVVSSLAGYHGLLYGTTPGGGDAGLGTIFTVDPSTGTERTIYSFKGTQGGNDAGDPNSALIQSGNKLYGTSFAGGTHDRGAIYRLDPATATVKAVYSFRGGDDGDNPTAPLVDMGGVLYGTSDGGTPNKGVVFSFDPATRTERVLYAFTGGDDGATVPAGLVAAGGLLYGLNQSSGQFNDGVLFSIDPASGKETTLHAFIPAEGAYAAGGLIDDGGVLYGTQHDGGQTNSDGPGTVFAFDPATAQETTLHVFPSVNSNTVSAVIQAGGALYGTSSGGGDFGQGSIFKVDRATGAGKVVYSFVGRADGLQPVAPLIEVGGVFYGTTMQGGSGGEGTVFSYDPTLHRLATLHAFSGGADGSTPLSALTFLDGALYGTTESGGSAYGGTIFKIDLASGAETVLHSFGIGEQGEFPVAALIAADGIFYGTTAFGGDAGCGIIYAFNSVKAKESMLYSFLGGGDGCEPLATLLYEGGMLYGSTVGQERSKGTVFSFDPATGTEKVLHAFKYGLAPSTPLIAVGKRLFGTTGGGSENDGTILSINIDTGGAKTLYSFTGNVDGRNPAAALLHLGGTFYGTSNVSPDAGLVFTFVE